MGIRTLDPADIDLGRKSSEALGRLGRKLRGKSEDFLLLERVDRGKATLRSLGKNWTIRRDRPGNRRTGENRQTRNEMQVDRCTGNRAMVGKKWGGPHKGTFSEGDVAQPKLKKFEDRSMNTHLLLGGVYLRGTGRKKVHHSNEHRRV